MGMLYRIEVPEQHKGRQQSVSDGNDDVIPEQIGFLVSDTAILVNVLYRNSY